MGHIVRIWSSYSRRKINKINFIQRPKLNKNIQFGADVFICCYMAKK